MANVALSGSRTILQMVGLSTECPQWADVRTGWKADITLRLTDAWFETICGSNYGANPGPNCLVSISIIKHRLAKSRCAVEARAVADMSIADVSILPARNTDKT